MKRTRVNAEVHAEADFGVWRRAVWALRFFGAHAAAIGDFGRMITDKTAEGITANT